jgi:uncharacterized membrane protein YfcA
MELMLTYLLAFVIGTILGLTGGGGSILTVPVLVYVAGRSPMEAVRESLFVVGITALAGTLEYARRKLVSFRAAIVFALPSMAAVFLMRRYMLPLIPDQLLTWQGFILTKGTALMVLFALLMLIMAFSMLRKRQEVPLGQTHQFQYDLIGTQGFAVGVITGLLGAGGGFIIVPALVLLAGLPMKLAVGTSLLIISLNTLTGFLGDLTLAWQLDWHFLLVFSLVATSGVLLGSFFSGRLSAQRLRKGFAFFLLLTASYVLVMEIWVRHAH